MEKKSIFILLIALLIISTDGLKNKNESSVVTSTSAEIVILTNATTTLAPTPYKKSGSKGRKGVPEIPPSEENDGHHEIHEKIDSISSATNIKPPTEGVHNGREGVNSASKPSRKMSSQLNDVAINATTRSSVPNLKMVSLNSTNATTPATTTTKNQTDKSLTTNSPLQKKSSVLLSTTTATIAKKTAATVRTATTSKTTAKTTSPTTQKSKKPTVTFSIQDISFNNLNTNSKNQLPSEKFSVEEPEAPEEPIFESSREELDFNSGTHSRADYIVPIVGLIFAVPILLGGAVIGYRRIRDYWSTRHYRRMNFLIDGMYND